MSDHSSDSDDFDEGDLGMFEEPADFRPPSPKPTFTSFERNPDCVQSGQPGQIELRLPAKHSLWGHWLWNAGKVGSNYIDAHKPFIASKTVLELGAGSALPSLLATMNGASKVVITDYPERSLLENIEFNVDTNFSGARQEGRVVVEGFLWGSDPAPLLAHLPTTSKGFDVMILTDLIFNHTQQDNLVKSCQQLLSPTGRILLTFSSHVPSKREKDLAFFPLMEQGGFEIIEQKDTMMEPMFGDESYVQATDEDRRIRATVHLYVMRRKA